MKKRTAQPARRPRIVCENGKYEVYRADGTLVEVFASRGDAVACLDGLK